MPKPRNETPAQRAARLDAFERDAMPVRPRTSAAQPTKGTATMSHVVIRFYVGHQSRIVSASAVALAITNLREQCAEVWGGSTAIEGEGLFQGKTGFYRERCTVVETVAEINNDPRAPVEKGEKRVRLIARHAAKACAQMAGQECIMVTVQALEHCEFVTP